MKSDVINILPNSQVNNEVFDDELLKSNSRDKSVWLYDCDAMLQLILL